jgi:hypothetical protein
METRRIVLDYAPRRAFKSFHNRQERWAVLVAHRRAGKTVACVNDIIRRAVMLDAEHGRYAYVAPFLAQAKEVAWEYAKRFAQPIIAKVNEAELWIELLNGARIRVHGADNPDRLRGAYLDGVVLDEYADMRPGVWGEVIRPMLADRKGWATFIGTPKGKNSFWQLYQGATVESSWFSLMLKASESGLIDAEELEAARADMTPEQFAQEFECSFDAAILGAYYAAEIANMERAGRIGAIDVEPLLPVHTAWDLGIGDSTAIWFFQVVGNELRIVDFYEATGQAIPHYAAVIAAKGYKRGDDWVPHDAKVRDYGTGRTRIETMTQHGLKPRLVPDHKIMDGINAVRLTLPQARIDEGRCKDGIEALRQYRAEFDEKARVFKDAPKHDWTSHCADAMRYVAMAWREMKPKTEKPKIRLQTGQVWLPGAPEPNRSTRIRL